MTLARTTEDARWLNASAVERLGRYLRRGLRCMRNGDGPRLVGANTCVTDASVEPVGTVCASRTAMSRGLPSSSLIAMGWRSGCGERAPFPPFRASPITSWSPRRDRWQPQAPVV
jgi:hypothetical protein